MSPGSGLLFATALAAAAATPGPSTAAVVARVLSYGSGGALRFAGLAIALGNPKTMLFYVALLPGIVGLDELPLRDALILGALASSVVGGVLAAYVLLAERFRRHLRSPVALRRISRGGALLMAVSAGAIVSR